MTEDNKRKIDEVSDVNVEEPPRKKPASYVAPPSISEAVIIPVVNPIESHVPIFCNFSFRITGATHLTVFYNKGGTSKLEFCPSDDVSVPTFKKCETLLSECLMKYDEEHGFNMPERTLYSIIKSPNEYVPRESVSGKFNDVKCPIIVGGSRMLIDKAFKLVKDLGGGKGTKIMKSAPGDSYTIDGASTGVWFMDGTDRIIPGWGHTVYINRIIKE